MSNPSLGRSLSVRAPGGIAPVYERPGHQEFLADVLEGLKKPRKQLAPKYFYDERGACLFEAICELDEYYIPETETAILLENVREMADLLGTSVLLIEYGCGNCAKTRILLDHLDRPVGFVPIDMALEQLQRIAAELGHAYPGLDVLPVCADFTRAFDLPGKKLPDGRTIVFFPGSTLGNFDPLSARDFLNRIADICGPEGALLIGVDLRKDPEVLHRAYNDSEGVTAAFNLNLLLRINSELGADFRLDRFKHYAFFSPGESRVEMHLVSLDEQTVHIVGSAIHFARGESIWTESSYKYTLEGFEKLAASAGFQVERVWTDDRQWFSVQYLVRRRS